MLVQYYILFLNTYIYFILTIHKLENYSSFASKYWLINIHVHYYQFSNSEHNVSVMLVACLLKIILNWRTTFEMNHMIDLFIATPWLINSSILAWMSLSSESVNINLLLMSSSHSLERWNTSHVEASERSKRIIMRLLLTSATSIKKIWGSHEI
jgi:hypothetical protein